MNPKIKSRERWEENFDDYWLKMLGQVVKPDDLIATRGEMKENIRLALHSQKLQLLERIEKWAKKNSGDPDNGYNNELVIQLEDLLKLIKEMEGEK